MNIGIGQIRGALLQLFFGKSTLIYLWHVLPSISKTTLDHG